ncbi:MAG: S1 RNA-binding domain-containing protein [Pirellulaceae bacterium]|nr:S1 RNA-binding domain-containing protein [Planctomycetaceae bacterium]
MADSRDTEIQKDEPAAAESKPEVETGTGSPGNVSSATPPDVSSPEVPESVPTETETAAENAPLATSTPETTAGSSIAAKVKVGRQDGGPAPKRRHQPRPNVAETPTIARRPNPVTLPSKRENLEGDLQAEFDDIFSESSIDDLMDGVGSDASSTAPLEIEAHVQGTVTRVVGDDVFIALGGHHDGVASNRHFKTPPGIGEKIEVVVARFNAEDGYYEVSIPGASVVVGDWSDIEEGAVVEARVTGSNTGGLECVVGSAKAFIPASQISIYRVENFDEFINQKLVCTVTEANPNRKNLVLSRRSILEREQEEKRAELIASIKVGDVRDGIVRRIQDFGAFVDIGGIDGLVHISQLSWDRVNHPSDVVEEGQTIQVKVEKIDPETGRIGLSYRNLQEHPWDNVEETFTAGSVHAGVVSKIANFGAFVKLATGVEGLVHISELAHHRVVRVDTIVKEGQDVEVKVLDVDREKQRMSLSLKALQQRPTDSKKRPEQDEDVVAEPLLPKHEGPLKGGVDHPSGGEQFGLKW